MKTKTDLRSILQRIDRRGYKAYREIQGTYQFDDFTLLLDHVQGDPFAEPSRMRVRVDQARAGFPPDTYQGKNREIGLRDYLTRQFHQAILQVCPRQRRGTGRSGLIQIDAPGQEILLRTSCLINERFVEARFKVGLPAAGRSILAKEALVMLFHELPQIVGMSLFMKKLNHRLLYEHLEVNEDQDALRQMLEPSKLVAFVAEGSCLPRMSGVDDRPLEEAAVLFRAPESLQFTFTLPTSGEVTGMGIPEGVTLIIGGGYHGKSTLLDALQRSVYNHIPGDGRERCVTVSDAVKIRAEDGRNIETVDISPFINNLPYGKDTTSFSTPNASGSTSQAANIIEMLEVGATALFIDEDTSATNFMIRDRRMQLMVAKEKEPITPLIDKIRLLCSERGVSTVLVVGGSGDYFDVADTVIGMEEYVPKELTAEARRIVTEVKTQRSSEGGVSFGDVRDRIPMAASIDASRGKREVKITTQGTRGIGFGTNTIDLTALEQLVSPSQTLAVAKSLVYLRNNYMNGLRPVRELMAMLERDLTVQGLDVLSKRSSGEYALPRRLEVAGALNRLRSLRAKYAEQTD
ncbi:MAG: ABC-ATPase domain-containing protein [Deltaproteobacteria bacterium]|nr:MAG: ABC-ATPase domain-containing protein [Deltaproteobacteria bacterium]